MTQSGSTAFSQPEQSSTFVLRESALTAEAGVLPGTVRVKDSNVESANYRLTTESAQSAERLTTTRLRSMRSRRPSRTTFQKLELREGLVLSVEEDSFRARLVDPEDQEPDEELEIEMEQVSTSDRALVEPGALFFWAIGYLIKDTGRRQLTLKLEFRRLPRARQGYEARAQSVAAETVEALGWI